jgi:hypothetical protein
LQEGAASISATFFAPMISVDRAGRHAVSSEPRDVNLTALSWSPIVKTGGQVATLILKEIANAGFFRWSTRP